MKLIFVRSPYFVVLDQVGQVESKVELFIWKQGDTEPTTPTYTLSKQAASASITKNVYNISPFIKQYIENILPPDAGIPVITNSDYVKVKYKRYYSTTPNNATPTLLDTTECIAMNGFTNYNDGFNNEINGSFIPLTIYEQKPKINKYIENDNPSLEFFIDYTNNSDEWQVEYTNFESIPSTYSETLLYGDTPDQYLFSIAIKPNDPAFNYCKMNIKINGTEQVSYIFKAECESKYQPIRVNYVNRYGAWDFINFFKAKTESYDVKNKEYQLLPDNVDYNVFRGESKFFNYEAKKSVKLNTGWVDESFNEFIKDLMVSETIILGDKPVKLKTMTTDLKTSLQDKMINYQIEFEYNYNQINNLI